MSPSREGTRLSFATISTVSYIDWTDMLASLRVGKHATWRLDFSETKISLFKLQGCGWPHSPFPTRLSNSRPCSISPSNAAISSSDSTFDESSVRLESHPHQSPSLLSHHCEPGVEGILTRSQVLRRVSPFQSTCCERGSFSSLHPPPANIAHIRVPPPRPVSVLSPEYPLILDLLE
ncbi:hypothetical protein DL96DRAFT_1196626 [Flagelloscypha sp. PMI_526]|nr:hypothetical protein DL96DRAFT_1196626 [Flagelloscypha sp. PMI_526]